MFGQINPGDDLVSCDRCQAAVPVRGQEIHATWCLKVAESIGWYGWLAKRNQLEAAHGQPQP